MENRIREQQMGLFADRTSSSEIQANQLRLYFSSFAYVMVEKLRRVGLAGTKLGRGQSWTLRGKFLKIGAQIQVTTCKVRHLISGPQRKSVQKWADGCRRQYRDVVVKETSSGEKVYRLEFGFRKVRWPARTEPLYLVVVDGLGPNPLILLTNRKVTRSRKSQWRVVESYLSRWRVEETIRFIKQSYQLE